MAHANEKSQKTTFLDLPPELRNRIYEATLIILRCQICHQQISPDHTSNHTCDIGRAYQNKWPNYEGKYKPDWICLPLWYDSYLDTYVPSAESKLAYQPALTRVSKVVRSETLPMFYGLNKFQADAEKWGGVLPGQVRDWLQAIGQEKAKLLRHVRLYFSRYEVWEKMGPALDELRRLGVDMKKCKAEIWER